MQSSLEKQLTATLASFAGRDPSPGEMAAACMEILAPLCRQASRDRQRYRQLLAAYQGTARRIESGASLTLVDTTVDVVIVEKGGRLVLQGRSRAGRVEEA